MLLLAVHDESLRARLAGRFEQADWVAVDVDAAADADALLARVSARQIDCVLVDRSTIEAHGSTILRKLRGRAAVVVALVDDDSGSEMIDAGATATLAPQTAEPASLAPILAQALTQRLSLLESALDALPAAIVVHPVASEAPLCSAMARAIEEQSCSASPSELAEQALSGDLPPPQDLVVAGHDGQHRILRAVTAHLWDRDGNCRGAAVIATDISRERLAQSRAERAARVRDDLVAIVSHDLRNPLNAASMAVDELVRDELSRTDRARFASVVRRSLQRCTALISDLLDVNKMDNGGIEVRPEATSARSLLDRARTDHEPLAHRAGVALEISADSCDSVVMADRRRISQVLANLVGNAIAHTPRAGCIQLAACRTADGATRFEVLDSGPGVAEEDIPRLFDRFWQARRHNGDGAGLGLAIVKGIVTAHSGTVGVSPRPEGGSRFYFTLPAA